MNKPIGQVSSESMQTMMHYDWPGNVRELENLIERAMIVAIGDTLEVDPHWFMPAHKASVLQEDRPGLAELERRTIMEALAACNGKIYGADGAAAALGLKPTTLYGKMRKHQIPKHAPAR